MWRPLAGIGRHTLAENHTRAGKKTVEMIDCKEESHGVFAVSLFERNSCESIVSFVKTLDRPDDWTNAQVAGTTENGSYYSAVKPDIRSASLLASRHGSQILRDFDEKIHNVIKPLVKQIWRVELTKHFGTHMIRYSPGGHYVTHQDAGQVALDRYFTVVCYLNDDFEGGHTWFPSLSYSAIPECGKAILFPSTYFHRGEPVTRGEKYVLVTWILGPIPISWI